MKTVILCGGQGTRIRDVAENIPKPMIPIGGLPILWHLMKYYSCWGHSDFVLCLGYKGQTIKDFFLSYEAHTTDFTVTLGKSSCVEFHNHHQEEGWRVTLAETGQGAMTGARVRRVQRYVEDDENFMLTYGDGLGDVNLERLVAFHLAHGKVMTITGVRPSGRFGELVGDSTGHVVEFNEKPQSTSGLISGGFFICRRELFHYLDDREDLVLEQEPMRRLVQEGQMMVYEHAGFWQPMDTYRDYVFLNKLYESCKAPWVISP